MLFEYDFGDRVGRCASIHSCLLPQACVQLCRQIRQIFQLRLAQADPRSKEVMVGQRFGIRADAFAFGSQKKFA